MKTLAKSVTVLLFSISLLSCSSMYEKDPHTLQYDHQYHGDYHQIDKHKVEELSFFEQIGMHIISGTP